MKQSLLTSCCPQYIHCVVLPWSLVLMSKLNYQLKGVRCATEAHVGQLPLKVSQATLMRSTAQQTGMISR